MRCRTRILICFGLSYVVFVCQAWKNRIWLLNKLAVVGVV